MNAGVLDAVEAALRDAALAFNVREPGWMGFDGSLGWQAMARAAVRAVEAAGAVTAPEPVGVPAGADWLSPTGVPLVATGSGLGWGTFWEVYAACPRCKKPAGRPCVFRTPQSFGANRRQMPCRYRPFKPEVAKQLLAAHRPTAYLPTGSVHMESCRECDGPWPCPVAAAAGG